MTQLSLTGEEWDLSFDDTGDLVEASGPQETTENSKFRLQIIAGELFEDERPGVPWLTDMVDPRVSIDAKKQILRATILSTPGVQSLDSLTLAVNDTTGTAEVAFSGTATNGEAFASRVTLA